MQLVSSFQGPLSETFGDFWRMMWEQRSATIVMMTKLEERARVKCDAYWPAEGSEMYGPIIVTLTDSMELATYTVRTFQIEKVSQRDDSSRDDSSLIIYYAYSRWLDD